MQRVVNVRVGREGGEAGQVAFISLHCVNYRKEDSALLLYYCTSFLICSFLYFYLESNT